MSKKQSLNDRLKTTLTEYMEANSHNDPSECRIRRELLIARFALEEASSAYVSSIDTLKEIITTLLPQYDKSIGQADNPQIGEADNPQIGEADNTPTREVDNTNVGEEINKSTREVDNKSTREVTNTNVGEVADTNAGESNTQVAFTRTDVYGNKFTVLKDERTHELKVVSQTLTASNLYAALEQLTNLQIKSSELVLAAKNVASIARMAVEIESALTSKLDVAQIYSIITQLPHLLQSLLNSILLTQIRELAPKILPQNILSDEETINSFSLNFSSILPIISASILAAFEEELQRNVNVLMYQEDAPVNNNRNLPSRVGTRGVIEAQVVEMLRTVPTHEPVVYEKKEDIPKLLRGMA